MIAFLALAAIQVGLALLGRLLKPLMTPRERHPDMAIPRVDEGQPLPIVMGTGLVNPILMAATSQFKVEGDDGDVHYFMTQQLALCQGVVDFLLDIQFDEKSVALAVPTQQSSGSDLLTGTTDILNYTSNVEFPIARPGFGQTTQFYISAMDLFGGVKEEGGVAGVCRMHWGENDQEIDPLTDYVLGTDSASQYPGVAYICLGADPRSSYPFQLSDGQFYLRANNPTPAAVKAIVQCFPHALLGTIEAARIGHNANPAEVLYALLTLKEKGAGVAEPLIDKASFYAGAIAFRDERLGISATVDDITKIDAIIDDIDKHCDCTTFQHPETGEYFLKLARNDYKLADLVEINEKNASSFTSKPGQWDTTYNDFKLVFQKFEPGVRGHVPDEILSNNFDQGELSLGWVSQLNGRNISNLVITDSTTGYVLVEGVNYTITNAALGIVSIDSSFDPDGVTQRIFYGDVIRAEYDADPLIMGFHDGLQQAQNLANMQRVGVKRTLSVNYPFFTDDISAAQATSRLMKQHSPPLRQAHWTMNRWGHGLIPGGACKINMPRYGLVDYPMRVLDIGYGLFDQGLIEVDAVEDIFADDRKPSYTIPHADPIVKLGPPGPPMVVRGLGDAIRIGLFPTDYFWHIEVQRADDGSGTGATTFSPAGGVDPSDPSFGGLYNLDSQVYIDDPQPIGTTKWYRAREIRTGFQPGPWTKWLPLTADLTTPGGISTCALPSWQITKIENALFGTSRLEISDPQNRLIGVTAKTIIGNSLPSVPLTPTAPLYEVTVPEPTGYSLNEQGNRVEYTVKYLDCAGSPTSALVTVVFGAPTILSLVAKMDAAGHLTADFTADAGSIQIVGKIGSMPTDAEVDAAAAIDAASSVSYRIAGMQGTTGTLDTAVNYTDVGYVKARASSGSGGLGVHSDYVVAILDRANGLPGSGFVTVDQVGVASGVASLDSAGLIPPTQLPALALENIFVVNSEAAMLALDAQDGDVAKRTDLGASFMLATGGDPTVLADWIRLQDTIAVPTIATRILSVQSGALAVVGDVSPVIGLPKTGTLTGWEIQGYDSSGNPVAGSAVVDVLRGAAATPIVLSSIAGTAKPTLASAQRAVNTTLTGWGSTSLVAGDTIQFKLSSLTTAAFVVVALLYTTTDPVS